ncbi:hypothetical protein CAURIC_00640 [Corynebacterium auriscanis]|nr:hypothetical protein CAURIC_00640 [Corynebacterium auriscanis]
MSAQQAPLRGLLRRPTAREELSSLQLGLRE